MSVDVQHKGRVWLADMRDRVANAAVLLGMLGYAERWPPDMMVLGCAEPVACWHGGRVKVRVYKDSIKVTAFTKVVVYTREDVDMAQGTLADALRFGAGG